MNNFLKNWDAMRIIRLVVGVAVVFMAIIENQIILSIIGVLLIIQAVMNFGCSANGCNLPSQRRYKRKI